jgi:hypothetical protein
LLASSIGAGALARLGLLLRRLLRGLGGDGLGGGGGALPAAAASAAAASPLARGLGGGLGGLLA